MLGTAVFLVFLYFTALPNVFPAGTDGGFAGTYIVNGEDTTGLEYSGTVVIVADADVGGDTFFVEWIVGPIQHGTGVLSGDEFIVEWESEGTNGPISGEAVYVVADDGSMTGTRTVDGSDEIGTEELVPAP